MLGVKEIEDLSHLTLNGPSHLPNEAHITGSELDRE